MAEGLVLVERAPEGYAVLTLNRPEAMNALSAALRRALAEAVAELAAEPSVRVLVLTGAGRAFCAGLDLKELGAAGGAPASVAWRRTRPTRCGPWRASPAQ